jgi:nucleoside-diphosphate-sugar epimerase
MKTALVTGINGFLGSHLAKRLSNQFHIIGIEYQINNLFRLDGYDFKVINSSLQSIENIKMKSQLLIVIAHE